MLFLFGQFPVNAASSCNTARIVKNQPPNSPPSARKIKTNYFIVSLAFADLLVSVLVMPFGAIELVHQHWIYGETFCLVRTSLDVLLTTASILHLCCIALDR